MAVPFLDVRGDLQRDLQEWGARYGIPVEGAFGGGTRIPNTRARLSHAYTIRTKTGRIIGAAQRTDMQLAREVKLLHGVEVNGHGEPHGIVTGAETTQTLTLDRIDLYEDILEQTFTDYEITLLTQQRVGLRIREEWTSPRTLLLSRGRRYEYRECFFASLGRQVGVDGDRVVRANASFTFLTKEKITA